MSHEEIQDVWNACHFKEECCTNIADLKQLREDLHYTKGCCDLAMKHRDQAESDLESLLTVLEQKVEKWSEGKLIDEHADELRSLIEGYRNEAF